MDDQAFRAARTFFRPSVTHYRALPILSTPNDRFYSFCPPPPPSFCQTSRCYRTASAGTEARRHRTSSRTVLIIRYQIQGETLSRNASKELNSLGSRVVLSWRESNCIFFFGGNERRIFRWETKALIDQLSFQSTLKFVSFSTERLDIPVSSEI